MYLGTPYMRPICMSREDAEWGSLPMYVRSTYVHTLYSPPLGTSRAIMVGTYAAAMCVPSLGINLPNVCMLGTIFTHQSASRSRLNVVNLFMYKRPTYPSHSGVDP